jgi:DNA-binding response OmpR family regulator
MAFKLHLVPPNPYITLVGGIKMAATIPRDNLSSSPLLDDVITIIVLENEPVHKEAIQDLIKESNLGWPVFFAKDKEEVEKLAEEHNAAYYVLDINLGPEKSQEGITTAEFIKNGEQNAFIAMFSANLAEFKEKASRIGVDYFEEKSGNIQWNVCRIALEMLRYQKHLIIGILEGDRTSICKLEPLKVKSLTNQLERINKKLAKIEELEIIYSDSTASRSLDSAMVIIPPAIKEDKSIQAYEKLMEDEAWVTKFNCKYVAFADGKQLEDMVADNLTQLIDKLRNSIYKSESIFYMQISKEKKQDEFELPMSWFDIELV